MNLRDATAHNIHLNPTTSIHKYVCKVKAGLYITSVLYTKTTLEKFRTVSQTGCLTLTHTELSYTI
jgi:hypothetical protein